MKLKGTFVLTELGDGYAAVPTGGDFRGIIRLNVTSRDIWQGIAEGKSEEEIAAQLVSSYSGVDEECALRSVRQITDLLRRENLLYD